MKRSVKIFAFVLASIFCFAAMSFGVFALDTCPDHPHQGLYTKPYHVGYAYYHEYYCSVCDNMFGVEDCNFREDYDCTTQPDCILCDQLEDVEVYKDHLVGNTWYSDRNVHYQDCQRSGCLQTVFIAHDFVETVLAGTVYLVCRTCGYNRAK